MSEEKVVFNIYIDKDKRTAFKIAAAKNETTMSAVIKEYIDNYIKENE